MTVKIHAQVNVLPHLAVGIAQLRTPADHPVRRRSTRCARSCAIWPLDRRDDGSVALAQQGMQLLHRQHHRMAPLRGRCLASPVPRVTLSAEASMDYARIRGKQGIVRHDRGFGRRCVAGFLCLFRREGGEIASGHSGFLCA